MNTVADHAFLCLFDSRQQTLLRSMFGSETYRQVKHARKRVSPRSVVEGVRCGLRRRLSRALNHEEGEAYRTLLLGIEAHCCEAEAYANALISLTT